MTKMPRDLWKRIVDSGFVAIVTVLSFLSFFVWRLLTSESDVKNHQKVQIGCFTSPSIRGISEKQSFLVYFQLGIISAFSALWRCGNSVVSVHHINNFWKTRSNLTKFSGQSPQWLRMVCAELHVKRLRIDWEINEKRSADVVTTLAQCFALITFEVLNQTPPNLLGSCRSSSRWYLQYYIKNGWELTSESTSKWIYILKYSSKFHTNLINNFWSTRSNSTEFTGQWP